MIPPRLALPAYFDPLRDAPSWELVIARALDVRMVILNPSSGPGRVCQDGYAALSSRLREAGLLTIGYVNTDYGARPRADVRDDCAAYRDWYDLDGVFLDQVSSEVTGLDAYEQYVLDARSLGCRTVVLNPGVYPHPAYVNLANLVVTFDGDLAMHRKVQVPEWASSFPAERFCHLVYGVPERDVDEVRRRVARSNTRALFVTDGLAPNPWGTLAGYWEKLPEWR